MTVTLDQVRCFIAVTEELHFERVTGAQVEGIRRDELDMGLARPPFDTSLLSSRIVAREPLRAVVPTSHRLAAATGPLGPEDFDGLPVISYHPSRRATSTS